MIKKILRDSANGSFFIIPHTNNQFIVYLPVHGIVFIANGAAVNKFHNALDGDRNAQLSFGLSPEQVAKICRNEENKLSQTDKKHHFRPTTVSLFLTTDCSMKCTYCYASAGDSHLQIKMEYVEVAVSEVIKNALLSKKKNVTVNYHGGGDIGVVWDLVEKTTEYIQKEAKKNNIGAVINSGLNGVLSDYQRGWIVKNTNSATVSIDGYREIQNMLRPLKNGNPSFDIVHATLKYFDAHDFNYAIRSTATAETIRFLEKITGFFCENYKVKKIKIEPVYIQGRASQNSVSMPLACDFVKYFLKAQKIASDNHRELLYSGARFDILTNIFCMAAGSSFGVTPDGFITSCYEVLDKLSPASDLFFYGKIEDGKILIHQDRLDNLASLTVEKNEKCQRCFAKFHCAGDCPVKAILSEKNEESRMYRCAINRELTKHQLLKSIS
jgi:uncharacterized protein